MNSEQSVCHIAKPYNPTIRDTTRYYNMIRKQELVGIMSGCTNI
jgi:hypothetical protein